MKPSQKVSKRVSILLVKRISLTLSYCFVAAHFERYFHNTTPNVAIILQGS